MVRIRNAFSSYLSQGLKAPSVMKNEGSNLKGALVWKEGEEGRRRGWTSREVEEGEEERTGGKVWSS